MSATNCNTYASETIFEVVMIIHLPAYHLNPYNRLLADGLAAIGMPCVLWFDPLKKKNPRHLLDQLRSASLVHWHWLHSFYQASTPIRFIARSTLFVSVMAELRLRRIPQVVTVHNLLPHERQLESYHRFTNRLIGTLADRLLVHHSSGIDAATDFYGNRHKFRVVPHPDYGLADVSMSQDELRSKWGLNEFDHWTIVFGGIRRYKRIERAAAAAGILAERGIGLLIAGPCPDETYADELKRVAGSKAKFLIRQLSTEELDELILASDAVLMPYGESLTSGAAHLAVSRGRPIISTDALAFEEFISRGLAVVANFDSPLSTANVVEQCISMILNRSEIERFRDERHPVVVGKLLAAVYNEIGINLCGNQRMHPLPGGF